MHSRCIEYPFAASRFRGGSRVLDVGTAKADSAWIHWLSRLPCEVHATDYESPGFEPGDIQFSRADVRELPYETESFDQVFAVSVVEHIGLANPQVYRGELPDVRPDGDLEAVRELTRILKPGGELVMTLPYGKVGGLVLGRSARAYTAGTLGKFESVISPTTLDYYEYQKADARQWVEEFAARGSRTFRERLVSRAVNAISRLAGDGETSPSRNTDGSASLSSHRPGRVTWRRVPITEAKASFKGHTDGIVCGVWQKQ